MDKLELKHLAPYLPYGVKVMMNNDFIRRKYQDSNIAQLHPPSVILALAKQWQPILRPLSDLTKEIEHNGKKFVPIKKVGWSVLALSNLYEKGNIDQAPYWVIQKLFEWNFDVFGLIENGLAIDMNKLTKQKQLIK